MIVILGAGITGLSIAYHLKERNCRFIIIEKEKEPGGLCRNINIDGYVFNYTGHFLHCRTIYVENLIKKLLPNIRLIKRNSYVYLYKRLIPYPIQLNIQYLPILSRIKSSIWFTLRNKKKIQNLEDWFISNFGKGLYEIFFLPYNEKLWRYPIREITPNFLVNYVPKEKPSSSQEVGYNAKFFYPPEGIGELISSFSKGIEFVKGEVKKIDKNYVYLDSKKIKYEKLISTIPLPELLKMFYRRKIKLKEKLIWNSVLCLNIGIKGEILPPGELHNINFEPSKFHWIYFPEREIPFYRVGSLSNVYRELAPKGCSSLWVEISYRDKNPSKKIIEIVIKNLEEIGMIKREKIDIVSKVEIPYAYPIYNKSRENILREIKEFLENYNITLAGRFGKWEYSYMEESILEGKRIAENLCEF
ncbi:MAG: FAD-dependent oxidoreductase [candidate division WOR-3 bacterium]